MAIPQTALTPLTPNDRRRRQRVQGDAQGWIVPASHPLARHAPTDDEAWEVCIHDVSRFGVGFSSTISMTVGEEHRLRIGRGPTRRARLIRIAVCREGEDGAFTVGAEFIDTPARSLSKAG